LDFPGQGKGLWLDFNFPWVLRLEGKVGNW